MTKAEAYWILDELRKEFLSELCVEACGIAQECIEFADLMQDRTQTKTNADRIRSMTDKELAKILCDKCICPPTSECAKVCGDCVACRLEWLQKPAEKPKEDS